MSEILDIREAPEGTTAWWWDGKDPFCDAVYYFGRSYDADEELSHWVPCVYDAGLCRLRDPTDDANWLGVMFSKTHGTGQGQARQVFADKIKRMAA